MEPCFLIPGHKNGEREIELTVSTTAEKLERFMARFRVLACIYDTSAPLRIVGKVLHLPARPSRPTGSEGEEEAQDAIRRRLPSSLAQTESSMSFLFARPPRTLSVAADGTGILFRPPLSKVKFGTTKKGIRAFL